MWVERGPGQNPRPDVKGTRPLRRGEAVEEVSRTPKRVFQGRVTTGWTGGTKYDFGWRMMEWGEK